MNPRWRKVDDILGAAIVLPPSERKPYIARCCGRDLELRWQVETLIQIMPGVDESLGSNVTPFPKSADSRFPTQGS